jgi:uncharacterized membrane protein HdeD (DUF308 family)
MENSISISTFWGNSHHWRLLFALGILTSICGIWFFVQPEAAFSLLSFFFGLSLFIGGFILLMMASVNRVDKPAGWWGLVVSGGFGVAMGVFLMMNLEFVESALPYIFAFVLLFQAIFNISFSVQMYHIFKLWWAYLLNGILLLILSFVFFFYPFSSAMALVFVSAIMMIYWGVSMIFISLDLRPGKKA